MTATTSPSADPRGTVTAFLDAWSSAGKAQAFQASIAEDCVWKNTEFPDLVGKAQILRVQAVMTPLFGGDRTDVTLVNVATSGDAVLTERIDAVHLPDGTVDERKVMGTFRVRDGAIVYFADYFDPAPYRDGIEAIGAAAVRA